MNFKAMGTKKAIPKNSFSLNMVAMGGLEPPRISPGDFESPVSTNFTTSPIFIYTTLYNFLKECKRALSPCISSILIDFILGDKQF